MATREFSESQVLEAVEGLGLDLQQEEFDLLQLWHGMEVEMEHGARAGRLDLTRTDPLAPAKIAVVHLRLCPDYYERLAKMREGAALADAARALAEESGTGMVHHRPPCRAVTALRAGRLPPSTEPGSAVARGPAPEPHLNPGGAAW